MLAGCCFESMISKPLFFSILIAFAHCQSVKNDCIFDPTQTHCADYELSENKISVAMVQQCKEFPLSVERDPRSVLNRIPLFQYVVNACRDAPHADLTCKTFIQECRPGSVISECGLPSIMPTNRDYSILCALFPKICGTCRPKVREEADDRKDRDDDGGDENDGRESDKEPECSPIIIYSSMCSSHASSDLPECKAWTEFCLEYNESTLCPVSGPKMPKYQPFLHLGGPEYILVPGWVTNSYPKSLAALIVAFFLGFVYEIQAGTRKRLQAVWALEDKRSDRGDGTGEFNEDDALLPRRISSVTFSRLMMRGRVVAISVKRRSIRSSLRLLEIASIVCMLSVACSLNVVYITGIAAGLL